MATVEIAAHPLKGVASNFGSISFYSFAPSL